VRAAAAETIAMFDWGHALPALTAMEKDADPNVATAVRNIIQALRNYRFMNPDRRY
jgi:HEAT repeat protein